MKFCQIIESVVIIGGVTLARSHDCASRPVELVLVLDASSSFQEMITDVKANTDDMTRELRNQYPDIKFALTTFVDKPVPFRGTGHGRGMSPDAPNPDYCYKRFTTLTSGPDALSDGFAKLSEDAGRTGGDSPEDPYEGLLYAVQDPAIGWSTGDGSIRFAIILTDDVPHYNGDAQLGVNWWTGRGDQGGLEASSPHFWQPDFQHSASYYPVDAPAILPTATSDADYERLVELHSKEDTLTPTERRELATLTNTYGPGDFADLNEHPGDFETCLSCEQYEYPTLQTVAERVRRAGVIPLVLVAEPLLVSTESELVCQARGYQLASSGDLASFVECATQIYKDDLAAMGLEVFQVNTIQNEATSMVAAVNQIVEDIFSNIECNGSTATEVSECSGAKGGHSDGTVAGVGVGCATAGAALASLFGCLWLRGFAVTRSQQSDSDDAQVEPPNHRILRLQLSRDQEQGLAVEDFA